MENLLSLAFDNLSSFDSPKVRKGLRQVEGLLAQICLSGQNSAEESSPTSESADERSSVNPNNHDIHIDEDAGGSPKKQKKKDLAQLSRDPAFREFFKLQEGFQWNVATRLVGTLDRLLAQGGDGSNDLLILSALDLTQGLLLLHPPSKALFSREQNMNVRLSSPSRP